MEYCSIKEWTDGHGVADRTARNYCSQGKIKGTEKKDGNPF